ncbi:uncharacterized protein AB675_2106 [Cyphellophora attinorum]|uniref:Uncharacterized protein n=1 Tax=Cyphellophora attinorum TaxID=1664694 RepID=A0A0N0NQ02_9EURO|nr:uncharacterized protein AB675_2106 [Phialophora attinorum]KPI43119.1 hypothetical protein AB675_2106 [Phialophora attinorum]
MKTTSALMIRSLISKLHPPAPPTARESKQLLRMLDARFQSRLDAAHPAPNSIKQQDQDDGPSSGPRPASTYVDSILAHPLLESEAVSGNQTSALDSTPTAASALERHLRNGTLTMSSLQKCALQYLTERKRNQPAKTRLAPKLAAWFDAASPATKDEFFRTWATEDAVIDALYADHAHNTVWSWLQILYQRAWASSASEKPAWLRAEDHFISKMMHWSIINKEPISAAQQFIAATKHRMSSGSPAPTSLSGPSMQTHEPLQESWARLTSYFLHTRGSHGLPAATFDSLLDVVPSQGRHSYLTGAFFRTYHPQTPNATTLYNKLRKSDMARGFATWVSLKPLRIKRAISVVVLDAAELSLSQGRTAEATFFLEFAQQNFPEFISRDDHEVAPVVRLERARAELGSTAINWGWKLPRALHAPVTSFG